MVLWFSEADSTASFGTILDDGPGGPVDRRSGSTCGRKADGCGGLEKSVFESQPELYIS